MRTRRQNRYIKLRSVGFLPFESRALSKVPFKICPYMRQLIKDRQMDFRQTKREGATQAQWENRIKDQYKRERWLRPDKKGKLVADPWTMLRDYEDRWRAKEPEYTSPWEKKWRNWRDFLGKIERTMQKQRGVA